MDPILAFAMAQDEKKDMELAKTKEIRDSEEYILNTYGIHNQTLVACEELGELIQALSKTLRGGYGTDHLIEEIADAEVMIDQIRMFYGIDQQKIDEQKLFKLRRQLARIRNSKEEST